MQKYKLTYIAFLNINESLIFIISYIYSIFDLIDFLFSLFGNFQIISLIII